MRITGYSYRDDFDRVMEINDACYSGVYCAPREKVKDMCTVSDVFIAREQAEYGHPQCGSQIIVGFAIVRHVFQPYIWNIAVDPAYQKVGIGGNLLREIIRTYTLAKTANIALHVNVENPAQKLYFDYGFRVKSVQKKYFDPNDALFMERKLP